MDANMQIVTVLVFRFPIDGLSSFLSFSCLLLTLAYWPVFQNKILLLHASFPVCGEIFPNNMLPGTKCFKQQKWKPPRAEYTEAQRCNIQHI